MPSSSPILESVLDTPRSQLSFAYQALRVDILAGRHVPGQKLKVQDIAAKLKVSPGAVREALSRLVPEQLVVFRDQRGFHVAPLSIADLNDLTDLRCEIVAVALRRSVEHGDVNWEAQLVAAAHRLRAKQSPKLGAGKVDAEWMASHFDFHAALISACGSPRLLALHDQLFEQSERYRSLLAYLKTKRHVADEHQELTDFALARDTVNLVSASVAHIRRTSDAIIAAARKGTLLAA